MMIQKVGYDPDLIDWAGVEEEVVGRMTEELEDFHRIFEGCFKRVEQRVLSQSYLMGLLSDIPRKNVEAIALAFLGPEAVRCQQNFLSLYGWDDERMLERHQGLLAEAVGEEEGMHTVDSSEIPKKGKESVGGYPSVLREPGQAGELPIGGVCRLHQPKGLWVGGQAAVCTAGLVWGAIC